MSMKSYVLWAVAKYRAVRNHIVYRRDMKHKIENAAIEMASLTPEERTVISAYWKGKYGLDPDYNTFLWYYSVNGTKDIRYIPEDIYATYIWPVLNDMSRCRGLNDKNLLDVLFSGKKMPETVFRNVNGVFLDKNYKLISLQEALALAAAEKDVVIKPAIDSCQGNGVICIPGSECECHLKNFRKDYIVQKVVRQHSSFAQLNDSSVNVVRMTSLLLDGEVHVLDSIIRVGAPGNFTDHKNIAIGIDDDGHLRSYGVTVKGIKVDTLPNGLVFGGLPLAGYAEMKDLVRELHSRLPQAGLIGWDLTTAEDGQVVIIEANLEFPGCGRGQDCNGPFFGELTDKVLCAVLKK